MGGELGLSCAFAAAAIVSLGASGVLVSRLERVGERLHLTEAMLGLVAALAADGPEISAAVTAIVRRQAAVSIGVILGSNAFNLAALLGLSALVAGRIRFHRRVLLLEGTVALAMVALVVSVILRIVSPVFGVVLALVVLVPYVGGAALRRAMLQRLPLPARAMSWFSGALREEEEELATAIRPRRGRPVDAGVAGVALVIMIGASAEMERFASTLGGDFRVRAIIVGALVLAAVTSLPNAVAAIYLASRGRGAATLSVALNSNSLNVIAGFLAPSALAFSIAMPRGAWLVVAGYAGLTVLALALAFAGRGLSRRAGLLVIAAYAVFAGLLFVR